ncbi:S8 family serine peptidase [Desulfuromonas sp. TF]|uniref:S8 family serine peptidase n=1 Tax=Desulfuromonas sp. TF TaxID=1232410 RepID=UPI000415A218|nr:S8 family serine peptidase [Desulfuromonas sp. TF]
MNPFIPILLLVLFLFAGCEGGGGGGTPAPDDGGGDTPSPTTGIISGTLIVPPNHTLEIEPNETAASAQLVSDVQKVAGRASVADPGFILLGQEGISVQDLYRLEADGPVRITLTLAANDPVSNNLDLILMNADGILLDASNGSASTELVETLGPGIFLAGVRAASGASAYLLSLSPIGGLGSLQTQAFEGEGEFVPDELLVKMREGSPSGAVYGLASGHRLKAMKEFSRGLHQMQIAEHPVSAAEAKLDLPKSRSNAVKARMIDEIRKLQRNPFVEYAEPNYIRKPSRLPNDDLFDLQWHYSLINLPQAWDRTIGSSEVTTAVLDTGILPGHPDLQNRLVSGYDFVSNPDLANDGDGIDPDPTDPGDGFHEFSSSFHGTLVAGIVAAETDNIAGVAGVTWATRLMPLRVLGIGGGTDANIAQAIRYAAGLPNNSGTFPERPADVINMSFGGSGFSQTVNDAVQDARAAGSVLVAAAGNNSNSIPFYPASYAGVLAVAAVDLASQRAPYSNFGPQIDLAAPGGDSSRDLNGDGHPDGILSTDGDIEGNFLYRFQSGTSFSAPHVAGVVALMLGVNPSLSPADIDQLVSGTHPETGIQITRDLGTPGRDDLYGHGLIDASKAILAAQEVPGGGGGEPESRLAISATVLDFDFYLTGLTFEISNAGSGVLNITDISSDQPWLSVIPTEGNAPLTVRLTVNRNGLSQGNYQGTVTITSDAAQGPASATVQVFMSVGEVVFGNVGNIFVLLIDEANQQTVAQVETDFSQGYAYSIGGISPGSFLVVAGTDRDEDGIICDIEDACGFYPLSVTVNAGSDQRNLNFTIGELIAPQTASLRERIPLQNLIRLR